MNPNMIRLTYWMSEGDDKPLKPVKAYNVPNWVKQDGIIKMLLDGEACQDPDTGFYYGATRDEEGMKFTINSLESSQEIIQEAERAIKH